MLPSRAEIQQSLEAALLLARGDRSALEGFDFSFEGFWKSFFAALIVLPLYLIVLVDQYQNSASEFDIARVAAVESFSYVLGWILFPILGVFVVQAFDRRPRYVPLVVVNNWGAVPQAALLVIAILIAGFFGRQSDMTAFLMSVTILITLTYQWYIIRVSLEISGLLALGILIFYVVVTFSVNSLGNRIFGGG